MCICLYIYIYIYIYSVRVYVCINTYSITDMCCCQLAAAVARLLPVLNSSCLCFVAPKQGPDSGPKNGATIRKLTAQPSFQICGPNFAPMVYAFAFCKKTRLAATGCFSFMFSCVWCQDAGFTCRVRSGGRQKACRPTAPKMGQPKERFKRCRDARAALQQACEVEL